MFSTSTAPVSWSPAVPSASSTCWQKPCVVVTVAASKTASASSSRRRRTATLGRVDVGEVREDAVLAGIDGRRVGQAVAGADQALPHPLAQLAGRLAAEADDEQLVHRRDALGDVARDQAGDGERLAGAGAGLEHGGALGQRAEQVERLGRGHGRRHVCTGVLVGEQPAPEPPGEQPEPVGLVGCQPAPPSPSSGRWVGEHGQRRVGAVEQDVLGVGLLAGEPVGQPLLARRRSGRWGCRSAVVADERRTRRPVLTGSGSGARSPAR